MPPDVDQKMHAVLVETAQKIARNSSKPEIVPKQHVWYDANYVGMFDDHVIRWVGWSLNLRNAQYDNGTFYIDYVRNDVPPLEQEKLWGASFSEARAGLTEYVCLFTIGCHPITHKHFEQYGFVCREYVVTIHPSCLASAEGFLSSRTEWWVDKSLLLMQLRSQIHKAI